ncbi:MAG: EAL domain-containing protein [Sphingomonadales bacterium]|nr:EAL domain-containing protein [Sphingomonadales bacterium]MDE2170657.1 EAL domain-containing protein [Sphingomonadales bacterium]
MVLGLKGLGSQDAARLRGFQYAQLAKVSRTRLLTQALAALVVVALYAPLLGMDQMAIWCLALVTSLLFMMLGDRNLANAEVRQVTAYEFLFQAVAVVVNALVWSAVLWVFVPYGPRQAHFEIWTVLAMLMTVSAVVIPTVPMATLLFSAIVGGAAIGSFVGGGYMAMAGVAGLFIACIALGTVESARQFLLSRMAVASVAERNEVVSLLLRESEDEGADWLWTLDARHRVSKPGRRFADAIGLPPEDAEGQSLFQLIAGPGWETGDVHPSLRELVARLRGREGFAGLAVRVHVMGRLRWWEMSGAPRWDAAGGFEGFHGVASDVTEQRETAERIAYLARYDTLTGLPNRMMVTEALGDALARAGKWNGNCALMMIDLDRFKAVNDTLGHPVGDALLAQVAQRLRGLTRSSEMVGRLGGDEFAIVLTDGADSGRIATLADAVIDSISQPFTVGSNELQIGASIGSAMGPRDGRSVEEMMRNADLALYRSKGSGRGIHSPYDASLQARVRERERQEDALRTALEREQFHLQYQPVVDLVSERVVGFEALVRWQNPTQGLLGPDQFVPLAEETGLILPLGQWVLNAAAREAAGWPGPARIGVNVTPRQVMGADFVDSVVQALAVSGLAPQRLDIEVTESIFKRDPDAIRATLERILALGCTVSLDDFGSGHSSLDYLRKLQFSSIKVDRGFVKGALSGNVESLATIRAVVAMAQGLEMGIVAEGVETAEELALMRELGCTRVQGYFFGRPMDSVAINRLFARENRRARQV